MSEYKGVFVVPRSKENPERCIAQVRGWNIWYFHQCSRKRGHGPDGRFCKQHGKKARKVETGRDG